MQSLHITTASSHHTNYRIRTERQFKVATRRIQLTDDRKKEKKNYTDLKKNEDRNV